MTDTPEQTDSLPQSRRGYRVTSLVNNGGDDVPWAKQIVQPVIHDRVMQKGLKFRGERSYLLSADDSQEPLKPLDIADAKAFISATRAQAQMMGEYILDTHNLSKRNPIPIVYAPDSGIVTAKGIAQAFKNRGYKCEIVAGKEQNSREFDISEHVRKMAEEGKQLVICDGTVASGGTLSSLLSSALGMEIPDCHITVAANHEINSESDYTNKMKWNSLTKMIRDLPSERRKNITLLVAARGKRTDLDPVIVGKTLQFIRNKKDVRQNWGTRELMKSQDCPDGNEPSSR